MRISPEAQHNLLMAAMQEPSARFAPEVLRLVQEYQALEKEYEALGDGSCA